MIREKKCKYCREKFKPLNSFQKFCFKDECIKEHNNTTRKKKIRELKKAFRQNDKSYYIKQAQIIVNKYIRLRDSKKHCISCDTKSNNVQYHAGHYKPMGNNQQLRYYTLNIHKQCSRCNNILSANLVPYRENLIKKIGLKKVEEIESNKQTKKYNIEYLKRLINVFKKKIKLYENNFR